MESYITLGIHDSAGYTTHQGAFLKMVNDESYRFAAVQSVSFTARPFDLPTRGSVRINESSGNQLYSYAHYNGTAVAVIEEDDQMRIEVHSHIDQGHADKVLQELITKYRTEEKLSAEHIVEVWFEWYDPSRGRRSKEREIAIPEWTSTRRNYPASTHGMLDALARKEELDDTDGKLLLLHGPPGTGKTNYLRSLAYSWREWSNFHIVIDPETFLNSANYMTEILMDASSKKHRWLVLEDCGELIATGAQQRNGQGVSRLLNLADGILGQGQDLGFIITTNEPISSLEPAITRPGRCLAEVELGAFTAEEASAWLGEPVTRNMTLADMYAHHTGSLAAPSTPDGPTGQYL